LIADFGKGFPRIASTWSKVSSICFVDAGCLRNQTSKGRYFVNSGCLGIALFLPRSAQGFTKNLVRIGHDGCSVSIHLNSAAFKQKFGSDTVE
jgi:hypothetical protein